MKNIKDPENSPTILLTGFGELSLLAGDFQEAFPDHTVITSQTAARGIKSAQTNNLMIQPVYLLPGFEYEKLCREAALYAPKSIIGTPLLSSSENKRALAGLMAKEYAGKAVLFVGHGSGHAAGAIYADFDSILREAGLIKAFVGVLEGQPDFDRVRQRIAQSGVTELLVVPLMLTAGKHVRKDILGQGPDSWCQRLAALGLSIVPIHKGLLEYPAVRQMFIASLKSAPDIWQRSL